jgi:hypothetical protein
LSGLAHVTLPGASEDDVWVMEGVNNLLVASDLTGKGHVTDYPSDKDTIALQLPFREGRIPEHVVLHSGACKVSSQVQLNCTEPGPVSTGGNPESRQPLQHLLAKNMPQLN